MNSERSAFIDAWAEKIKSGEDWRREHDAFINAQVHMANEFYKRFFKEKGVVRFKKLTGCSDAFLKEYVELNGLQIYK